LATPEKFFLEISQIPDFKDRVNALIFKENYEDLIHELGYKIESLTAAFNKVLGNSRLHTVLGITLAVANYLNG
jgi:hypothetical protein